MILRPIQYGILHINLNNWRIDMTKKEQLYYALNQYIAGKYKTNDFCDAFYNVYYPDVPVDELSESELAVFDKLAYAISRFSNYEEDFKRCPKAFVSEAEIKEIALETQRSLIKLIL